MTSRAARADCQRLAAAPPAPSTIEESGLTLDLISQLLVKTLYGGEASGLAISERMCLPYTLLETTIEHARAERLIEVRGTTGSGSAGYRKMLTEAGRDRAGH